MPTDFTALRFEASVIVTNAFYQRVGSCMRAILPQRVAHVVIGAVLCSSLGCGAAASSYNVAGVRMYQQGQYPGALQQFQQAVATQPTNADAYYNMASTLHRMGTQQKDPKALGQAETLYNQSRQIIRSESHRLLSEPSPCCWSKPIDRKKRLR